MQGDNLSLAQFPQTCAIHIGNITYHISVVCSVYELYEDCNHPHRVCHTNLELESLIDYFTILLEWYF